MWVRGKISLEMFNVLELSLVIIGEKFFLLRIIIKILVREVNCRL